VTVQTLKLDGKEFVLLSKPDFVKLRQKADRQDLQDRRDAGDIAESRRRKARGSSRPYSELRRKLGLQ